MTRSRLSRAFTHPTCLQATRGAALPSVGPCRLPPRREYLSHVRQTMRLQLAMPLAGEPSSQVQHPLQVLGRKPGQQFRELIQRRACFASPWVFAHGGA